MDGNLGAILKEKMKVSEFVKGIFMESFDNIAAEVHDNAVRKGFWEVENGILDKMIDHGWSTAWLQQTKQAFINQRLTLIIAEAIEAFEDMRKGKTHSEHIPDYTCLEEELADIVIRVMDTAKGYDLDLSGAILAKMEYNSQREYLHGKKF